MYLYFIILIIIIILLFFNIENFQSIRTDRLHGYNEVDYIPVKERNKILTIPVINYDSCREICSTTPDCDGFNYALNNCTLYKNLRNPLLHSKITPLL